MLLWNELSARPTGAPPICTVIWIRRGESLVALCNGKPPDGVTEMIGVDERAGGMWIGGGMAPALAELFDSERVEEPACAAARDDCEESG